MQFWFTTLNGYTPVIIEAPSLGDARERAKALGVDHDDYVALAAQFWMEDYRFEVPIESVRDEDWHKGVDGHHRGIIVHYDDGTSKGFIR